MGWCAVAVGVIVALCVALDKSRQPEHWVIPAVDWSQPAKTLPLLTPAKAGISVDYSGLLSPPKPPVLRTAASSSKVYRRR